MSASVIIVTILVCAVIIGSSIWVINKGYSRKWDE
jgi:heme/copper-type cytochrome/quinol oxidase subunit 4